MTPTETETALWVALNQTHRAIHTAMEAELRARGLPPLSWYDILWAAERSGPDGIRAFELTHELLFEQSNLSRSLRKMVNAGLLTEESCPRDRRSKVLKISKKGEVRRREIWQTYGQLIHLHTREIRPTGKYNSLSKAMERTQPRDTQQIE